MKDLGNSKPECAIPLHFWSSFRSFFAFGIGEAANFSLIFTPSQIRLVQMQ
jgi:hypothetical protein